LGKLKKRRLLQHRDRETDSQIDSVPEQGSGRTEPGKWTFGASHSCLKEEARMDREVRSATRLFLGDIQRLGFLFLRLGTGIWLDAALCMESLVVDTAEVLEQRRAQLERISHRFGGSRVIQWIWGRAIRAARLVEPGIKSWRRLATRIDRVLLEKCRPAVHRSITHPEHRD